MVRTGCLLLLFGVAGAAMAGCSSTSEGPMLGAEPPTFGTPPGLPVVTQDAVIVENRTELPIDLGVREINDLTIDRSVIEGSVLVPIGPAEVAHERREQLFAGQTRSINEATIHVVGSRTAATTTLRGGVIRVGQGPAFLAIGRGTVFVRSRPGSSSPDFEAQDPRQVVILPVAREMAACNATAVGAHIEGLPTTYAPLSTSTSVVEVIVDAGCHVFRYVDPSTTLSTKIRACLPEGAYPFATTDALVIGSPPKRSYVSGVRITNGNGAALELLRMLLAPQRPLGPLTFSYELVPSCVSIHPDCGDVRIPLSLDIAIDAQIERDVALGTPLTSTSEPSRTFYVLAATGQPVGVSTCVERAPNDIPGVGAGISVAIVEQ